MGSSQAHVHAQELFGKVPCGRSAAAPDDGNPVLNLDVQSRAQ